MVIARTTYFTVGTQAGDMLRLSTPRPSSSGANTGSPAISPHTLTGTFRWCASSTMCFSVRITAGCVGSYKCAMRSFTRSTASRYWMRSLVPTLKNAQSLARMSAVVAALGISIIAPTSMVSSNAWPRALSSVLHSASTALAWPSSSEPLIIGYISRTFPCALASRMARSWSLKISGCARQNRIARKPMNGLSSLGNRCGLAAIGLSPPRSSERMMTGCGASASATVL